MDVSLHRAITGSSIEEKTYEAVVHPNGGLEVE